MRMPPVGSGASWPPAPRSPPPSPAARPRARPATRAPAPASRNLTLLIMSHNHTQLAPRIKPHRRDLQGGEVHGLGGLVAALQGVQHDRGPPLSLGWGLGALGGLEGGEGLLGPGEGTWYCREGSSTGWKEWREVGRVVGREVGGGGNSPPPGTSILGLDTHSERIT